MSTNNINIPEFLKSVNEHSQKQADEKKIELILNGTTIHSLKELQEHFNADELMKYHIDGELLLWLQQHYYEKEAEEVEKIDYHKPGCLPKLCSALGIDYIASASLSEEEKEKWEQRKKIVSEYTTDEKILSKLWLVATNQEELAELLNRKEKQIYLCNETFSIPIKVSGIEYINIGNATIDNPYTKEQYEKAGIKMSGFTLAKAENPATSKLAKDAAIANGYDDFHETHTPLATAFHNKLKSGKYINTHRIQFDTSIASTFFKSKYECETTRKRCIQKAYDEATNYLTSGNSISLSNEVADYYSERIISAFTGSRDKLETLCSINGTSELYRVLTDKIDNSRKKLKTIFEKELDDNSDYYSLYKFEYFLEMVDIEKHDNRISEDFLGQAFEALFTDNIQYTLSDLFSAIIEINNDLDKYATTFYSAALSEYKLYVSEIEDLLDKIGKNLPATNEKEDVEDYITRCCVKQAM